MKNPFKAVGSTVGGMFSAAAGSDCAPGLATFASVVATPIVAPVAFIAAFFQKGTRKP